MSVLYLVLPLALLLVGVAVWAYVWATRSGQLDDLDTPAIRALHDDPPSGRSRLSALGESSSSPVPSPQSRPLQ